MSSGTHRSHKIRRHSRQTHTHKHTHTRTHTRAHTRAHTHTHTLKGIYIISLIIFKRNIKEGNDEWFKLMTNVIQECVGVVAHLIRIWKNEFLFTQGLLPTSIKLFIVYISQIQAKDDVLTLNIPRSLTACPQKLELNHIIIFFNVFIKLAIRIFLSYKLIF